MSGQPPTPPSGQDQNKQVEVKPSADFMQAFQVAYQGQLVTQEAIYDERAVLPIAVQNLLARDGGIVEQQLDALTDGTTQHLASSASRRARDEMNEWQSLYPEEQKERAKEDDIAACILRTQDSGNNLTGFRTSIMPPAFDEATGTFKPRMITNKWFFSRGNDEEGYVLTDSKNYLACNRNKMLVFPDYASSETHAMSEVRGMSASKTGLIADAIIAHFHEMKGEGKIKIEGRGGENPKEFKAIMKQVIKRLKAMRLINNPQDADHIVSQLTQVVAPTGGESTKLDRSGSRKTTAIEQLEWMKEVAAGFSQEAKPIQPPGTKVKAGFTGGPPVATPIAHTTSGLGRGLNNADGLSVFPDADV